MKKIIVFITLVLLMAKIAMATLSTPAINSPGLGAVGQYPSISLSWYSVTSATMYEVKYGTSPTLASFNFYSSATNSYTINNLFFSTIYYWQVRAKNASDSSAWSAIWNFTTLSAATLNTPSSGSTGQYPCVLLDWYSVTGANSYQLEIDTSSNYNSPVYARYATTSNYSEYTTTNLLFGKKYYWRVRAAHATDTSAWTASWNFTTSPSATLYTPSSGSTGQYPSVLLDWYSITGANSYQLEIDTSSNYNSPVYARYATTSSYSEYTTTNLLFGKKYYWRVRAAHATDTSAWTASWNFTTSSSATLYTPTSGSTGQYPIVLLDWYSVTGANSYQLEIDTSSNYNSPVYARYATTSSYSEYTTTNLLFGKKYYWRVRAAHATDTSAWTASWNFTTVNNVSLYSPSNPTQFSSTDILIDWYGITGATNYDYVCDTGILFNSSLLRSGSTTSGYSEFTLNDLAFGKTWYWKVRARHQLDTSLWSAIWSFSINSSPSLNTPANNSTGISLNPTIYWNSFSGVTYYRYQYDSDPMFTNPVNAYISVGTNQKTLSNLSYGTSYYWKVQAMHTTDTSAWSPIWSFTTLYQMTSGPTLLSPANSSLNVAIPINLQWNTLSGALIYQYQIDINSSFSSPITGNTTQLTASVPGLMGGTIYYWRVRANNGSGYSPWSTIWVLTTQLTLDSPFLLSPSNNATSQALTLSLDWTDVTSATSYEYQYSNDNTFTTYITGNTTQSQYVINGLLQNTVYYWRIRANNGTTFSSWSAIWSFTTISIIPPVLTYPANGASNIPINLVLNWNDVINATDYEYQYSTDSVFNNTIIITTPLSEAQLNSLTYQTTYYWRVRSNFNFVLSPWSEKFCFTTINNVGTIDINTNIVNIFPNPANDILNIIIPETFLLPKCIIIYDILGNQRYVSTENTNLFRIDISDFEEGIYFLEILFNENKITKKIQIVKR